MLQPNQIRTRFGHGGRRTDWHISTRVASPWEGDQALATRNLAEATAPTGSTIVETEWMSGGEPWITSTEMGEDGHEGETEEQFFARHAQQVEEDLVLHPIDT
jgi:hypothetical protein